MRSVGIAGLGFYIPEQCVTNQELAQMVETTDEWIREKIGIQTRYIAAEDEALSDLAINAAKKALDD
ncbi:MAG: 3-oxoacyl-ACP synthase, partial [Sulfuricellaceae bacterium]|nr:3-oxoacyl-ACP synthase [Sulfuricellaceae bacterium]